MRIRLSQPPAGLGLGLSLAITDNLKDLDMVSEVVEKFEKVSGAILSRNKKCKVIGFGNWAGKEDWPLAWVNPVKSEKIFGIFICDSYEE